MKNWITVTNPKTGNKININVNTIGHVYEKSTEGFTEYTVIGTTCHNNGGFHAQETVQQVMKMIEAAS